MSSLEAAVSVLRCYSTTCSELTVTEVANKLSLPKSNVSRLLRSMLFGVGPADPAYPLELFQRVITLSLRTMEIVRSLPMLEVSE